MIKFGFGEEFTYNKKYKLEDLCELITDGTHQTPTYCESEGIIFLSSKDVVSKKINWDDVKYIPKDLHEKLYSRLQPQQGDILLAKNGTTGVAAIVDRNEIFDIYVSLALLRPKKIVSPQYLLYAINSPVAKRQFDAGLKGIGVPNLHLSVIRNTEAYIHSLDKQKEICNILDKVSGIISDRQRQLDDLDMLIKARFVEMFDGHGYPILKWNDVFATTTGKLDANAMVEDGEYPFFTCAKEVFRIDKYAFDQEALLLAGNNAAGKYDVKYYKGKFNAYQRTYVLGLKGDWSYHLFRYQLEDKLVYLQQQSLGGLTKYLTLKILSDLEFIIPPRDKQNEFDDFVSQVDKLKFYVMKGLNIYIIKCSRREKIVWTTILRIY